LWAAYGAAFPEATFTVWNRSIEGAEAFAKDSDGVAVATDLEAAVRAADIVTSATMTTEPILKVEWFQEGQHIDLIGAYRPDMREVDDAALLRSRVFVDSYATTMGHIGELKIPLVEGTIEPDHVLADYYELDAFKRQSESEITMFKNGGGAHLDLMTSRYILDVWKGR
jgi:ornithine cyclodeaminase